jgi:hypothetical protein
VRGGHGGAVVVLAMAGPIPTASAAPDVYGWWPRADLITLKEFQRAMNRQKKVK